MKKSQLRKLIRESIKQLMTEQTNPFMGGGTGPNWDAAVQAWDSWNASNQTGAPQPNSVFLGNMDGKGCGFYQKRLIAQLNSFVAQFGGSLGAGSNAANISGGMNPAWQSEKYARVMWLAAKVQDCNTQGAGSESSGSTIGGVSMPSPSTVNCINTWIDDPANDNTLTSATTAICNNGNPALTTKNIEAMKFRHKSLADCVQIGNKIDDLEDQLTTAAGCHIVRKTAKRDYLQLLHDHCC